MDVGRAGLTDGEDAAAVVHDGGTSLGATAVYSENKFQTRLPLKRSSKTTDGTQAAKLAIELSSILRNPNVWRKLPPETSEVVRAIWNGDIIDDALLASLEATRPRGLGDFYKPDWTKLKNHKEWVDAAQKILEENTRLYETNAILEAKVDNLTALLKKMGFEVMKDYAPKFLSQACVDFLSDDKRTGP